MKRTISFVRGKGDILHNNRQRHPLPRNVDPLRVKDNIIFKQESLEEAYTKCFGKAIEEYNKGKKPCRRRTVRDYMAQIEANQNKKNCPKLYYEWVIQVGDQFDSGHGNNEEGFRACTEILKEYMEGFQERNKGIYCFNMCLHLDEKSPHVHLDGFFRGTGFKTGFQTRNSMNKAFENMGFKTKGNKDDNGLKAWQQREREELARIARKHGIETTMQNAGKRKQLTVDEYKAIAQYADREAERVTDNVLNDRNILDKLAGKINEADYKKVLLAYKGKCNELERERKARAEEREVMLSMDATKEKQKADYYLQKLEEMQKETEGIKQELQQQRKDFFLLSEAFRKASSLVPMKAREKVYAIAKGIKGASVGMIASYNRKAAGKDEDLKHDFIRQ